MAETSSPEQEPLSPQEEEQDESRSWEELVQLLETLKEKTTTYKGYLEGLITLANLAKENDFNILLGEGVEEMNKENVQAHVDQFLFRPFPTFAILSLEIDDDNITHNLIKAVSETQEKLTRKIKKDGVIFICPRPGDKFNISQHEYTDDDFIILNEDPKGLHGKIASVKRPGFKDKDGSIIRKAVVRRYMMFGQPSTDIKPTSQPANKSESIEPPPASTPEYVSTEDLLRQAAQRSEERRKKSQDE